MSMNTLYSELADDLIDMLVEAFPEDDTDFSELHHMTFNSDYYIIGYYQASEWLKKHDICAFEAIQTVVDWEKENCGEVTTGINSEAIVNMYVYIKGEELLHSLDLDLWDCTKEELFDSLREIKDKR